MGLAKFVRAKWRQKDLETKDGWQSSIFIIVYGKIKGQFQKRNCKVTLDIQVNTSWGLVFGWYIFGAEIPPRVFGCLRLYHHPGPLSCTPHIQLVSKKSYSFNVWSLGLHLDHSFLFKCCLRVSAYSRRTSIFWPTSGSKVGWLKHQLYMRWNTSICRLYRGFQKPRKVTPIYFRVPCHSP